MRAHTTLACARSPLPRPRLPAPSHPLAQVKGDLGTGSVSRKQSTAAEKSEEHVTVNVEEPTELTFALRYLTSFTKATPLSAVVVLHMSKDVPLMVEYAVENLGHMRFYLAPKVDDAEGS